MGLSTSECGEASLWGFPGLHPHITSLPQGPTGTMGLLILFWDTLSELCPTCPWDSSGLCLGCHTLMSPCLLSTGKTRCTSCHSHGTASCSLSPRDLDSPPHSC